MYLVCAKILDDYILKRNLLQASSKGNTNQLNSVSSPTPAMINSLDNAINQINLTNAIGIISSLQIDSKGK
jgi:hypothetical protein